MEFSFKNIVKNLGEAFTLRFIHEHIIYGFTKENPDQLLDVNRLKAIIDSKAFLNFHLKFPIDDGLYRIVQHVLTRMLINEALEYDSDSINKDQAAEAALEKYYIQLSNDIVNHLIKNNIMIINNTSSQTISKNTISFKDDMIEEDILLQSSHYKPHLGCNNIVKKQEKNIKDSSTVFIKKTLG